MYYVTDIKVKDGSPWIWYFNEYAQSYVKIITCHFELNWRYDYILRGIFHFNICNIIQNWVLNDIAHQIVIHLKTSRCFQSHVFSRLTNSLLWRHIQLCTEADKCTRKGHECYFITLYSWVTLFDMIFDQNSFSENGRQITGMKSRR